MSRCGEIALPRPLDRVDASPSFDAIRMRWLLAAPLRPFVLLAAAASLLLNLAMLVPSLFMLQVFDRVFASRSMETLVMLCALTVLALAFAYCMDVVRSRALASAGHALHRLLAPAVLERSIAQAAAVGGPGSVDRLRDVARLGGFLGSAGVRALFDAPWLPIYLFVIGLMHPWLGFASGLAAVGLGLVALATERMTRPIADATLAGSRSVGHHAQSFARHAEVLVGMGMVTGAVSAWREKQERLLGDQERLGATSARLAALARVARQLVQIAVLALGAWLVVDAGASPGIMVAATILLGRALQPVEQLIGGWKQLVDARGAWRRLSEPDTVSSDAARLSLPRPEGRLEVERVVFFHEAARAASIKAVSFVVEAGESLGIVGASGSGKTTLVRLLLGIWKPRSGAVRLDNADIAQRDRGELGAHLGYLPQGASLMAGSVAQNIARMGPVDAAGVVEAARLAQAHEMILRLPQGYDTALGDGGSQLSGGQAQRIALARALYGAPALVVLDEPDAHLDAEGEEALKAALRELKARGATVVVVGHRAGLMAQLDRIAIMKDGALHAFGAATAMLAGRQVANLRTLRKAPGDSGEAVA
jgi:PrtD family type I secretion system ABC transporter